MTLNDMESHMPRNISRILLILMLLGLGACSRMQPVLTVQQPLPTDSASYLDEQAMQQALIRALTRTRWQIEGGHQGLMQAHMDFRGRHKIWIDIDYAPDHYNIRYRDSQNLDYADGKIHKRYNALVKKLNGVIQQELRVARSMKALQQ